MSLEFRHIVKHLFQSTLGREGMSLEFRHIASHLLWYCNKLSNDELLHEVILAVGHFTVLHPDNQVSHCVIASLA